MQPASPDADASPTSSEADPTASASTPPAAAGAGATSRAPQSAPSAAARSTGFTKPSPAEAELTERVLADVQRQIELLLEVRLREALAPILVRATDTLVRDARKELTATMREIVARAVASELGKPHDR